MEGDSLVKKQGANSMKRIIKAKLVGVLALVALDALGMKSPTRSPRLERAKPSWQILEVTNNSPANYTVLVGITDHQRGMGTYTAKKIGLVEPGQRLELLEKSISYDNSGRKYPYLFLQPSEKVGDSMRNIRVFFPAVQKGETSPREKEGLGERLARAKRHAARLRGSGVATEADYFQATIDTSARTFLLLADKGHLRVDDPATKVLIEPGKDIFIRIKSANSDKPTGQEFKLFAGDRQKYVVNPQTGPGGNKVNIITERGLSPKNNVKDEDITVLAYTMGQDDLSELESTESESGKAGPKRTNFDIWNKTSKEIFFEVGTEANPPKGIQLHKLAPHQSGKQKLYTISGLATNIAASSDGYLTHQSTKKSEFKFKPNKRGNAYLGVTINANGSPDFYEVSSKRRASPRPGSPRPVAKSDFFPGDSPNQKPAVLTRRRAHSQSDIRLRRPGALSRGSEGSRARRSQRKSAQGLLNDAPLTAPLPRSSRSARSERRRSPRLSRSSRSSLRQSASAEASADNGSGGQAPKSSPPPSSRPPRPTHVPTPLSNPSCPAKSEEVTGLGAPGVSRKRSDIKAVRAEFSRQFFENKANQKINQQPE